MKKRKDGELSPRLKAIVDALPLKPGLRVLEIGCGPGAAAREIANRIGSGHVLGIDRPSKAIKQAIKASGDEIRKGHLSFRQIAVEDLEPEKGEKPFDIALAVRVGCLDGRHPEIGRLAFPKIVKALTKKGKLFIDGGEPLKEIPLDEYR
jgi:SAM-dependent methyltransferase